VCSTVSRRVLDDRDADGDALADDGDAGA